jgi:TetR/AcrR family transcriptional regulator, transcriptional repressor of aconitase
MPRVSAEYLARQRAAILAGARRCFAEHGYEGATVARLEAATGRSRGAIFHHFPGKQDLFLAVLEADAEREAALWAGAGVGEVLRGLAAEDPDWCTLLVEQSRRRRTDPELRARWDRRRTALIRSALLGLVRRERAAGRLRRDLSDEAAARLLSVAGDGLLLQRAILGEVPNADEVIAAVARALRG